MAPMPRLRSLSPSPKAHSRLPSPPFQERRHTNPLGGRRSKRPKKPTIQVASPPLSGTSGHRIPAATTFIAMSSSRDGSARASLVEPFTVVQPLGSDNPRDLWKWMEAYESKTGGSVLAIAHNGNLSNGRMFPIIESFTGKPIDREYAETRAKWERLYEATQIKGDGETHPFLSPNDEFAGFERWDKGNLDLSELKKPDMLQYEYARSALKLGLRVEQQLGVNPYKFGLVGSTDAHTGLAAIEEDNFFGKTSSSEPSAERAMHPFVKT